MKVIICGGRSLDDYSLVKNVMDEVAARIDINEIICGEARGADSLGKRWAIENDIPVVSFPAEWDLYGKSAGIRRNSSMGNYADYVVAFWDGKSRCLCPHRIAFIPLIFEISYPVSSSVPSGSFVPIPE